jgi:hypothetical protein
MCSGSAMLGSSHDDTVSKVSKFEETRNNLQSKSLFKRWRNYMGQTRSSEDRQLLSFPPSSFHHVGPCMQALRRILH